MNFSMGYREVTPDQTNVYKWTEIPLNTGGTQSTLQDFKVAEKSGGLSYVDQTKYYTRNRFIYWRTCNHVLELIEESLDITLTGSRVRYKFDSPVLDGVAVVEVPGAVLVLVPTVSSVHRLSFPHPDVLHSKGPTYPHAGVEYTAQSIFANANASQVRHPSSFHMLNNAYSSSAPPQASAAAVSDDGQDCVFALAYDSGVILLVTLNTLKETNVVELDPHADAFMPRFLSRAFRGKTGDDVVPVGLLLTDLNGEMTLFSLCRDGNIRAWSLKRQQCMVATEFSPNISQGAQNHRFRMVKGLDGELYIAILHCYPQHSAITLLDQVSRNGSQIKFSTIEKNNVPKGKDVVEFAITGSLEVWMVLRTSCGDTGVLVLHQGEFFSCELDGGSRWEQVPVDADVDPKQAYLDFLFYPGRFPVPVINKALSIYRKANIITDSGVPTQVLKERVSAVVDHQIYGETRERQYTADQIIQLQQTAWQKFYSCVIEYYESGTRPLGLVVLSHRSANNDNSAFYKSSHDDSARTVNEVDESEQQGELMTSGVVFIKKSYISLLRPMDPVESIVLNGEDITAETCSDEGISEDLLRLVSLLAYLDDNFPDEVKMNFEKCLKQLKTPLLATSELFAKDLSAGDEDTMSSMDLLNNVAINVDKFEDITRTMQELLDLMDIAQPDIDSHDGMTAIKSKWMLHLGHLYNSQLGISFVASSINQIVNLRFQLCRSLLILEQLLQGHSFRQYLSQSKPLYLSPDIIDRTSHLIQCYNLLLWISQTPINSLQFLDSLETSVSVLKLNEMGNPLLAGCHGNRTAGNSNITILHLFLFCSASKLVRLLMSRQKLQLQLLPLWRYSFLSFLRVLSQLLWPICNNTIFSEFLLLSGQHLHVQEYTRLLSKWCHTNSYTRRFLLACSLIDTGEHDKAFDLFEVVSHGVLVEDFLKRRVLKNPESAERALVSYYTQVIRLYEQKNLHHLVVELAEKAIAAAERDEPELATLHSVAFLHQLQLGRYQAAFDALIANPDAERRRDCLQQLVVNLVDARKLNLLIEFNYEGVERDLERIVEVRARSLEVTDNLYYNFAYAYHVRRNSYRKAASVMYEQALRLSAETSLEALQKQCHFYAAAINTLSLVKEQDAWIVKPLPVEDPMDVSDVDEMLEMKGKVEVLETKDIEKEMMLCWARLRVVKFNPEHTKLSSLASFNAAELVALLTNACLFKDALQLANLFGISADSVLSSLAGTCVQMDETPNDQAWDWLYENGAAALGDGSNATLAWRLLEKLLMAQEAARQSCLHRAITSKLIQRGVFLPYWLTASYKKRNPAELLRLLLSWGRLEEACELAVEYVEAVLMGKGKERFGLMCSLMAKAPAVWLPHNTIDLILLELEAHSADDFCYQEGYEHLKDLMDQYAVTVVGVSNDKVKCLQQEAEIS